MANKKFAPSKPPTLVATLNRLEAECAAETSGLPQSVKGVLVSKDGKLLLMRRPGERGWDLPGGGVDAGESLADAFIRELMEEAGVSVDNAVPLYGYLRDIPGKDRKFIHYIGARLAKKAVKTKIKLSKEHDYFAFFQWADITELDFMPSYRKALDIARQLMTD